MAKLSLPTAAADGGGERVSTSKESEALRKMRAACRNTLELSTLVLADPHLHTTCRLIAAAMEPLRRWQSAQSKALRSCSEVLGWYQRQALGQGWACLNELVRLLSDPGVLSDLGVGRVLAGLSASSRLSRDDIVVINEDKVVTAYGDLILGLLGARLQTETCYTQALPLRLVSLLSDEAAPQAIEQLHKQYKAWQEVEALTSYFWKRVQLRSPFGLCFVQQVIELLAENKWAMSDKLAGVLRGAFSGLGQTKIVEDGFQKERHAESKNSNRRMALARSWMAPVNAEVLCGIHRFQEIDYDAEQVLPGTPSLDTRGLYYGRLKSASIQFPGLVSSQAPKWYSPAPQMFAGHTADLSLYEHCADEKAHHLGHQSWLSVLLQGGNICIRRGDLGVWHLAVASYSGIATLGWPMEACHIGGRLMYKLRADVGSSDTPFMHIVSLDGWSAFTFSWWGPTRINVETGHAMTLPALYAVPDQEKGAPLLHCVARKAHVASGVSPKLRTGPPRCKFWVNSCRYCWALQVHLRCAPWLRCGSWVEDSGSGPQRF